MNVEKHRGGWVILLSFCVALMLSIIPLPEWITAWRPDWVAMVLIYWCIAIPERVGVTSGWIVGVLQDVLSDTLLGQHALSLCILAYVSVKLHHQFRLFPWWQQAFVVGGLIAFTHLPDLWIRGALGYPQVGWSFLYPALSSVLFWWWVFVILRDLRRTYILRRT